MFKPDREQIRRVFLEAWRKANTGAALEPMEQQIVEVARRHPEYQPLLAAGEDALGREWRPEDGETNPFLHMGLHLGVLDQVTTDRPPGIRQLYRQMLTHCRGDTHEAEHRVMECLAETLWTMQRYGGEFDVDALLECIKQRGASQRFGH